MSKKQAELWRSTSLITRRAAWHLREYGEFRSCVSRAYYAFYQVLTSVCLLHSQFANGWNNPSHEQLPDLIQKNGDLTMGTRRRLVPLIRLLRNAREISDYRLGRMMNAQTARTVLQAMDLVFGLLEVDDDD